MSRTWRRWLAMTLFVVVLGFLFVKLGEWQLDRLDQRRASNATVINHQNAPVQPWQQVFDGRTITDEDQWQRVEVTGRFLDQQLQVRYRTQDGQAGWEILTPLEATDGRTVLVNRGFVPRPPAQDFPRTIPAPPQGDVSVVGYVRRDEQGADTSVTPTSEGTVKLINSDAVGAWLGRPLVNGYIATVAMNPPQGPEILPITPPPLTEKNHLSYALQWFAFAAIAVGGLVILIRNDIADRRKMAAKQAAQHAPTKD